MDTTSTHRKFLASTAAFLALCAASDASANPLNEFLLTPGSKPTGIVSGADGNLWFTEEPGRIGRMHPNGTYTEFAVTTGSKPLQIVVGPDNNLWFVEPAASKIGRITTAGVTKEFDLVMGCTAVGFITSGPHNNLWFPERCDGVDLIGEMKALGAGTGTIIAHGFADSGTAHGVMAIATGADGNIWFAESAKNAVGRLNVTSDAITEFSIPGASAGTLMRVTRGPDDNVWFAFQATLGRITAAEAVEEFNLPDGTAPINFMTAVADGSLWATDTVHGLLWRTVLTPSGLTATKFTIHQFDGLLYITPGPDGYLWFTEQNLDAIGRITPDVVFFDGLGDDP
jgi:streptogramin lyase